MHLILNLKVYSIKKHWRVKVIKPWLNIRRPYSFSCLNGSYKFYIKFQNQSCVNYSWNKSKSLHTNYDMKLTHTNNAHIWLVATHCVRCCSVFRSFTFTFTTIFTTTFLLSNVHTPLSYRLCVQSLSLRGESGCAEWRMNKECVELRYAERE